jgi:hypothetical protein
MKTRLKKITHNKKLLPVAVLVIVIVVSGSAYGLVQLTKTKPHTVITAPVKVKSSAKKATAPVAQTAAPTSNAQTEVSPATTKSITTAPTPTQSSSSTQSFSLKTCNADASNTQTVESGFYNTGLSTRNDGISVVEGYINELPSLESAYNSYPSAGTLQNVNNNITATQNEITETNSYISQDNDQIIQAQQLYESLDSGHCPSSAILPQHQFVPSLPLYTAGSTWNP